MGKLIRNMVLPAIFSVLLIISGCGENSLEWMEDDSSDEADQLEISQNLDSGNYNAVLNDPNANALDYSAAAMMEAGFDPIDLLSKLNEMSKEAAENDVSPILALPVNPEAVPHLETAIARLRSTLGSNSRLPASSYFLKEIAVVNKASSDSSIDDPDIYFQMAVTALSHALAGLASIGNTENGNSYIDPIDNNEKILSFDSTDENGISEAEAESLGSYIAYVYDNGGSLSINTGTNEEPVFVLLEDYIADDVGIIADVAGNDLAELGSESDLNEVFLSISSAGGIDYNGDGQITDDDISNYLTLILGN